MSQPCLPVPKRKKRKKSSGSGSRRSGGKKGSNDCGDGGRNGGKYGDDDDDNEIDDADQPVSFDDLQHMDAARYMAFVAQEARRLPDCKLAVEDVEKQYKKQTTQTQSPAVPFDGAAASLAYLTSHQAALTPPPSRHHLPLSSSYSSSSNAAWIGATLANFENLRNYLGQCQLEGVGGKLDPQRRPDIPPMKDREAWHTFCLGGSSGSSGPMVVTGRTNEEEKENNDTFDQQDATNANAAWWVNDLPSTNGGHPPTVRLLLQMDQVMIRKLISHFAHFVKMEDWWRGGDHGDGGVAFNNNNNNNNTNNHNNPTVSSRGAEWIYALLARLEKPVHRDDAAVLYSLLKDLTKIRARLNVVVGGGDGRQELHGTPNEPVFASANRNDLAQLNTLITIVGVFFDQGGGVSGVMTFQPNEVQCKGKNYSPR